MKRIKRINGTELYDIIRSRENVTLAVRRACKGHPHDPQVKRIKEDAEPYIDAVCEILDNESFHYSGFRERSIWERGKHRDLCYTRCFPDRIVQHAVMQVVAPILLNACTADTWAAQEGKGIHHAEAHQRRMMVIKLAELGLTLKSNWQIFPMSARGSDFLGFVTFHDHARIRKRIKISYKRAARRVETKAMGSIPVTGSDLRSVQSYEGLMGWCDSRHLIQTFSGRAEAAYLFGPDMMEILA